jgi:iron transport multicopper oxidase
MLSLTLFFLSLLSASLAKTVTYNWSIDFVQAAPDSFTRQVIGINGKWPLPPIEADVGDQVVVNVFVILSLESESTLTILDSIT